MGWWIGERDCADRAGPRDTTERGDPCVKHFVPFSGRLDPLGQSPPRPRGSASIRRQCSNLGAMTPFVICSDPHCHIRSRPVIGTGGRIVVETE